MSAVTVICSDPRSHLWPKLLEWCAANDYGLIDKKKNAFGGDLLILLSCTEIVEREIRDRYKKTVVIHESALPAGRGWSPFAWQILEGKNEITVTLLEAADKVDSGDIWKQEKLLFRGDEMSNELNDVRDACRIRLAQWAIDNWQSAIPTPQVGEPTYYARRHPRDSKLDPHKSIAEQFDLLRICEPRFPAFFFHREHFYEVSVRKVG